MLTGDDLMELKKKLDKAQNSDRLDGLTMEIGADVSDLQSPQIEILAFGKSDEDKANRIVVDKTVFPIKKTFDVTPDITGLIVEWLYKLGVPIPVGVRATEDFGLRLMRRGMKKSAEQAAESSTDQSTTAYHAAPSEEEVQSLIEAIKAEMEKQHPGCEVEFVGMMDPNPKLPIGKGWMAVGMNLTEEKNLSIVSLAMTEEECRAKIASQPAHEHVAVFDCNRDDLTKSVIDWMISHGVPEHKAKSGIHLISSHISQMRGKIQKQREQNVDLFRYRQDRSQIIN